MTTIKIFDYKNPFIFSGFLLFDDNNKVTNNIGILDIDQKINNIINANKSIYSKVIFKKS